MGMTMAEKILASRSGATSVRPGEYVWASVDGTAVIGPIPMMEELGITEVFDRDRIYAVNDHFAPSPTIPHANAHKALKEFARKHDAAELLRARPPRDPAPGLPRARLRVARRPDRQCRLPLDELRLLQRTRSTDQRGAPVRHHHRPDLASGPAIHQVHP